MKYTFTAVIMREDKFYVAHCPELGVTSQGLTLEESLENLKEAVTLYLREEPPEELSIPIMPPLVTTIEVAV
ncbi:MAG: type II toxin-antitoxin system HicB family antitoxin [Chloroflexi bacterium]|nr:type II toxin-antitoxin system HicB family antitoxin [Chloroflexota bacterium]